jgi:transcriptional regulator with XRE-family HTH domain
MIIGRRLYQLRQDKNLSQGDIQARTGLLRCYISRVENGHTVPSLETLEKLARAMEVPLYQLFFDGPEAPNLPNLRPHPSTQDLLDQARPDGHVHFVDKLQRLVARLDERDKNLVLHFAKKLAAHRALDRSAEPARQASAKDGNILSGNTLRVRPTLAES